MSRFVTVDAATYFSTPSVNLVDADTSHLHQSVGQWVASSGAVSLGQSTALAPLFGDSHGIFTASAGSAFVRSDTGLSGIPVSADTVYTASYWASSDAAARTSNITILWWTAAGAAASPSYSENARTALTVDTFTQFAVTATSPSNAAFASFQIGAVGMSVGDLFYWDQTCYGPGSDSTFRPSLEIVANDTYTKDPAGITAAVTAGVSLKVGDGWAGDAVSVTLQDGVGGPIVAKFDADDVRAAYPFGDLTTGSTWTDDTGREWTLNGAGATLGFTSFKHEATVAAPGQLLRTGG